METTLNLQSARSYKARYARRLHNKALHIGLLIVGFCSFVAGIFLLFEKFSEGFLALLPAVLCVMTWMWYKGELQHLKVGHDSTVEAVLDASTLGRLSTSNPSAYDIWRSLQNSQARYFFQNRYMVPPQILEEFLSKETGSASTVWAHAEQLQQKYHSEGYENAVVFVALLKSIPNVEQLLRQLQLELQDIEEGIEWTEHIKQKRKLAAEKHRFGGMARDWAYGYTPLLRYLGHNMSEEIQMYGFFQDTQVHQQVVDQMLQAMGSGSSTVTLVGDIGVGKTTCAYAFAERLLDDKNISKKLRYNQVVALDAPALLAQVKGPGELESLVIRLLNEAHKAKNIILFFDDAHVFFSNNGASSVDLSNVLQPALDSGSVRLVFAMTPREWQQINVTNGTVASKLQPVQVHTPNEQETIHVLRDQILTIEYQRKVVFTYQALREAYHLGSRYIDSQVMPGAALNVLAGAASIAKDGYVTDAIVKQSIESSVGVKLQQVSRDETETLLHLEDELHKYVINQKRAVGVIANALRRSRSGVGNPERPVGTFLFLGPTGVGKTELSKALARVYFGDVESIVRVDMNQYVQPSDVSRLITPMLGEQLGFLGQVRRQPFSVILLDEIEKAHPNVVNLLLQMLDEGVMRDIDHKPVSFKDAIIIATSNAGAEEIRRIIDEGGDVNDHEAEFVEYLIKKGSFAPEFLNRFDEIVLFRPLNQDELVQVIDLIIAGINKTLDTQKVQVVLTDQAKRWLVDKGYDSRLGARPMRRMAQRYVENILAKRLLNHSAMAGGQVQLDISDFEQLDGQT